MYGTASSDWSYAFSFNALTLYHEIRFFIFAQLPRLSLDLVMYDEIGFYPLALRHDGFPLVVTLPSPVMLLPWY